ncbi:hypothetical protein NA56DRAFT_284444 [Hyaloscypha hepaticicola]|uniref:2EXR domain-containing protein n=1 Tax=Hyaloscypha hepaticicola TaxID=2082293 RepID=A0A2J6PSL7_9HELO|nr:hypothetical protein NA56DRAFT_284444 [Hyaloscypha hepaticicola]
MSDNIQFSLFQKLPPELQTMVWEFAASVPRVLQITGEKVHPIEWRTRIIANYTINSPHQIPPTLHATSASRQVALKFYSPAFSFNLGHPVYFNFASDVLHYRSSLMIFHGEDIRKETEDVEFDAKKVENLMVEKDGVSPIWALRSCAAMFPRLKTVVLEYDGLDFGDYTFEHWTSTLEEELMGEWAAMGQTGVAKFTYMMAEEMNGLIENV